MALLAFALYPGGNARAEEAQQQDQSSVPEFAQENVNVAQGVVVSITRAPLVFSGMFDMAAGQVDGRSARPADASSEPVRRRDWYRHP